jgi:hypothetical protein
MSNLSASEWAEKADYEGGFLETFFEYGLKSADLSVEGKESEFGQALLAFEELTSTPEFQEAYAQVTTLMWEAYQGDDE